MAGAGAGGGFDRINRIDRIWGLGGGLGGLGDIPPDENYVPFVLFVLIITAARAKKPERLLAIRASNSRGPRFFAGQKKRAGSVLLSHGRVPHYPRRWSP